MLNCSVLHKRIWLTLTCLLLLQACNHKSDDLVVTDPASLYAKSVELLRRQDFSKAVSNFADIERDCPHSEFAHHSTMMRSYALYLGGNFVDAIFAAEDFVKLYPRDHNIDYMYYLIAVCEYDQIVDAERDKKQTMNALQSLERFLVKFPNSRYAANAAQKRIYAYNAIVAKEMAIGNLYLTKNKLIPALLRYQVVVRDYSNSLFVPEALYRLVELYKALGMKKDAVMYAAILGHNYPSSSWYSHAYSLMQNQ